MAATLTQAGLFEGYGGLSMAVAEVLGAELAWYSEIEPAACRLLAYHHPDVPNLGDVTAVDWDTVPRVDVLTAGYPCQPFSLAGRRDGANDERHLWPHVADALGAMRPALFVGENVRGHLTLGFDQVVRDLDLLDYDVRWVVLRAAAIGAPHGRARLFILGRDRARHIRGGVAGRRGLHRDSGGRRLLPGAGEGRDDRQGPTGDAGAGENVRRQAGEGPRGEGPDARSALLAGERRGCAEVPAEGPGVPASEGRGGGHRAADAGDARWCREAAERPAGLDGGNGAACAHPAGPDPGSEPAGPRSVPAEPAARVPGGGPPVGGVVGAGRVPVRACRVHRAHPCVRADGGWAHLRAADVGAPHGRFRIFITAWPAADTGGVGRFPRPGVGVGWDESVGGEAREDADDRGRPAADTDGDPVREQPVAECWSCGAPQPGLPCLVRDAPPAAGCERLEGPEHERLGHRIDKLDQHRHSSPATDPAGVGRGEGRTEPARLVGGPDAAVGCDEPAPDTDSVGSVRGGTARGRRAGSTDHRLAAADTHGAGPQGRGVRGRAGAAPVGDGAPAVADPGGGRREGDQERDCGPDGPGQQAPLRGNAAGRVLDWGDYGPAIERWQSILGRAAPAPTMTGKRGGQQLSPRFVEWMQGLPAGHVTDVPGLSRNEALKLLGNGVVVQQAAAALRYLLETASVERAA